ncbi:MAG TPA: energy transducer TonB [Vicinamibacterales bacterium]
MRRSFTLFSIVVHGVAIGSVLGAQALAVGALPTSRRALMFDNFQLVKLGDIDLPAPPQAAAHHESSSSAVALNAAPTMAPNAVTPETGRENEGSTGAVVDSVEQGAGSYLETVIGQGAPPAPPPPAPHPVPTTPIRLHSGMTPPVKKVDAAPVYPAIAQSARIEGVVILEAVIDAQGRVESARILRSIPLLDQAALDAVRQWRFSAARLNGDAVPVVMTVTVNFTLHER